MSIIAFGNNGDVNFVTGYYDGYNEDVYWSITTVVDVGVVSLCRGLACVTVDGRALILNSKTVVNIDTNDLIIVDVLYLNRENILLLTDTGLVYRQCYIFDSDSDDESDSDIDRYPDLDFDNDSEYDRELESVLKPVLKLFDINKWLTDWVETIMIEGLGYIRDSKYRLFDPRTLKYVDVPVPV